VKTIYIGLANINIVLINHSPIPICLMTVELLIVSQYGFVMSFGLMGSWGGNVKRFYIIYKLSIRIKSG
jgi:hypothetical protein